MDHVYLFWGLLLNNKPPLFMFLYHHEDLCAASLKTKDVASFPFIHILRLTFYRQGILTNYNVDSVVNQLNETKM